MYEIAITVDGNNVIEVYSAAKHACESVRDGNGPVFIEAITYRWREHCGTAFDNHIGYREEAEYEEWRKKCPIERFEKELLGNKTISPVALETMKSEIMAEIDAAVLFAKESPFLDAKLLPEFLYAQ